MSGRAASTCSTATAWRITSNADGCSQKQSGRIFIQPLSNSEESANYFFAAFFAFFFFFMAAMVVIL